jgi:GMP synthase (glutamine-hydrolysing)
MAKEQKRILITEHAPERSEGIPELVGGEGIVTQVVKLNEGEPLPSPSEYDAVISSGGPMGTYEMQNPKYEFLKREAEFIAEMIAQGKAVLGVCLGHQLLAHVLGGEANATPQNREVGWSKITVNHAGAGDPLFRGLPSVFSSFQYHGDSVTKLPDGVLNLALTDTCHVQAFRYASQPVWGVQFHPEISPEKAERILTARRNLLEQEGVDVFLAIKEGFEADHEPRKQIFYNFRNILQSM